MMKKLQLPLLFLISFALFSCKKCEECYFVEEVNGQRVETPIGEFCDDDIEAKESEVFICSLGTNCFVTCK